MEELENNSDQSSAIKNQHSIEFVEKFSSRSFRGPYDFIQEVKKFLPTLFDSDLEDPDTLGWEVYDKLFAIAKTNESTYAGMLYIFTYMARVSDIGIDMNYEILRSEAYDLETLTSGSNSLVGLVCENYPEKDFKYVFTTKLISSLIQLSKETGAEDIAEFILSCNQDNYSFSDDDENWISDMTLDILRGIGYDIDEFEGGCTVYANHWLYGSVETGYDYVAFSEGIRSHLGWLDWSGSY